MSSIMTLFGGSAFFPQNTCVAQRAFNSDKGKIAPGMQPNTARVGFSRLGGNTYLYNSTLLSCTGRQDLSINLNPILYPVQKITASKLVTWQPSSKTAPVFVKYNTVNVTVTVKRPPSGIWTVAA